MACLASSYPVYGKVTDEATRAKLKKAQVNSGTLKNGLTIVEMLNAAEVDQVKAMLILGANPMMANPDINHARKPLNDLDSLVLQGILPGEAV